MIEALPLYPSPERGGWRAKLAGWGFASINRTPPGRTLTRASTLPLRGRDKEARHD